MNLRAKNARVAAIAATHQRMRLLPDAKLDALYRAQREYLDSRARMRHAEMAILQILDPQTADWLKKGR